MGEMVYVENKAPKTEQSDDEKNDELQRVKTVKIKFDDTYNDHHDQINSEDEDEQFPLLSIKKKVNKMENVNRYQYNVQFMDDMLSLIKKKDIFPRLLELKLNSILSKVLSAITVIVIATAFRLFIHNI